MSLDVCFKFTYFHYNIERSINTLKVQICGSGLNRPKYEKEKSERKTESGQRNKNFLALGELE